MNEQVLESLLITVLNMTLTASVMILAVLLVRRLLRRAPQICSYALWAVVLFRLLCPVSFSSEFSLLGVLQNESTEHHMEYIPQDIGYQMQPEVELPIPAAEEAVNNSLPAGNPQGSVNPLQVVLYLAVRIWIMGILVMLLYSLVSLLRLRRKLKGAVREQKNIFRLPGKGTPFVYGLIHPRIYLPEALGETEQEYILLHERIHIRRGDHIFRLLAWPALCLHWFNPLVWLAFSLSGRDMEVSCDEAVLRKLGSGVKKEYSASLLNLAAGERIVKGIPMAFGESDTGSRIKHVLHYKKPKRLLAGAAVLLCIVAAAALLANPDQKAVGENEAVEKNDLAFPDSSVELSEKETEVSEQPQVLTANELSREQIPDGTYQPFAEDGWYAHIRELEGEDALEKFYTLVGTETRDIGEERGDEIIEIYTGNIGDGDSGIVLFKNAQRELLYSESAHSSRAGWNNIYLGESEGSDFVLTVHIENRDTYGEYGYQVFRLGRFGEIRQIAGTSFTFDDGRIPYEDEIFREWCEGLSYYLERSHLILSSQEGEIRTMRDGRISEADKYNYETLRRVYGN